MIGEIGSEFWSAPPKLVDKRFFLSGRTALEYIVRDILKSGNVNSVLLPSYCCHTMVEPFVHHGFKIRFYDVFCSEQHELCAELPPFRGDEALFYMSYFGFQEINGLKLEELRKKFRIIIDDRTHSWLRTCGPDAQPDYSFTSFRKWGAFSGVAEACKYTGNFLIDAGEKSNVKYTSMRKEAFSQKSYYMSHGGDKSAFLKLFGDAETLLENDYADCRPSYHAVDTLFSTDWATIRNRRKDNARYLLDGLSGIKEIILPFEEIGDNDAPLFVPILVKSGRDELRKYLIAHEVYCPVHWPKSLLHASISQRASKLYSMEMSLPCDQRYGREETERIVSLIGEYYQRG